MEKKETIHGNVVLIISCFLFFQALNNTSIREKGSFSKYPTPQKGGGGGGTPSFVSLPSLSPLCSSNLGSFVFGPSLGDIPSLDRHTFRVLQNRWNIPEFAAFTCRYREAASVGRYSNRVDRILVGRVAVAISVNNEPYHSTH